MGGEDEREATGGWGIRVLGTSPCGVCAVSSIVGNGRGTGCPEPRKNPSRRLLSPSAGEGWGIQGCTPRETSLPLLLWRPGSELSKAPSCCAAPIPRWAGAVAVLDQSLLAEPCHPVTWLQALTAPAAAAVPPPLGPGPARPSSFHGPKGHKQQTMMCHRIFLNVGKLWEAQQEASENG